jgi:hypothetical protein
VNVSVGATGVHVLVDGRWVRAGTLVGFSVTGPVWTSTSAELMLAASDEELLAPAREGQ